MKDASERSVIDGTTRLRIFRYRFAAGEGHDDMDDVEDEWRMLHDLCGAVSESLLVS